MDQHQDDMFQTSRQDQDYAWRSGNLQSSATRLDRTGQDAQLGPGAGGHPATLFALPSISENGSGAFAGMEPHVRMPDAMPGRGRQEGEVVSQYSAGGPSSGLPPRPPDSEEEDGDEDDDDGDDYNESGSSGRPARTLKRRKSTTSTRSRRSNAQAPRSLSMSAGARDGGTPGSMQAQAHVAAQALMQVPGGVLPAHLEFPPGMEALMPSAQALAGDPAAYSAAAALAPIVALPGDVKPRLST
ncbi:hypothetical protein APUTEX25_005725 [Auxenochlorella protothecoides]|uniref:Uncharacterized protein n=1 Tax=Auxenochlorella protothecoides TaxID=3075 RepID=A0A3M7KYW0_AUXPR|nr:hypothetical protein APUTEX25_005725 [Auxenochlorella protothecoides]|eukprot:RMZ55099.1 hypothetical protein APUTEX25_005725 [Auxenochlorella protothecoides]